MDISKNYYRVLQVSEDADIQVISAAYRALSKMYHPDIAGPPAASQMRLLNEAHDILSDPALRAQYDQKRDRSKDLKEDIRETSYECPSAPTQAKGNSQGPTLDPGLLVPFGFIALMMIITVMVAMSATFH